MTIEIKKLENESNRLDIENKRLDIELFKLQNTQNIFPIVNNIDNIDNLDNPPENTNITIDKTTLAQEWINANPPYDRQNTTEYFNTYHADAVKQKIIPVCIQEFSTLVKAAGYRQMRIKNLYSWVVR
jgi:hypothetical protein